MPSRVPCPACALLWPLDRFDACPLCGREPPRSTRDPGPDPDADDGLAADGGADVCLRHRIRYLTESGECPMCERLDDDRADAAGGRA
ncbi:hypothetical protein [Halobacterium litoreum]|uniref:Small CPxCG-related zinc finger protein n=1 Tax=Halobacterium litoreum TaxID=2039234 RepID=A0ABD5NAL1_9EURY|nr:hypothetical protein [Halobacterium litoreum]UHH14886.1 hypothetical protein LT972_14735 [Halobacterium litoreum]